MKQLYIYLIVLSSFIITSCEKDEPDDPIIPNEQEVITTLNYTLTPESGTPIILSFRDLDGDGGNDDGNGDDELTVHSIMSVHKCARRANRLAKLANTLDSNIGQHHWPAPLANNINTTVQQH